MSHSTIGVVDGKFQFRAAHDGAVAELVAQAAEPLRIRDTNFSLQTHHLGIMGPLFRPYLGELGARRPRSAGL